MASRLAIAAILVITGCSAIDGGKAQREDKKLIVRVQPDGGVIVEDNSDRSSTTQPTATGLLRNVSTGGGSADEIGFVNVLGAKVGGSSILLGVILLAGAVASWYLLKNLPLAALFLCAAILAFIYPMWLGLAALAVLGTVLIYYFWKPLKQTHDGIEEVKKKANGSAEIIETELAKAQDKSTKAVISNIKGKP